MKRVLIAMAVLVLLASGVISAIPFFVSSDTVRSKILHRIQELTGRAVAFRGNPSVSLSPFLGIEITDLIIADPHAGLDEAPLLKVELVRAKLNLLPALSGNAEITKYELIRPRLNLRTYSDGKTNWRFEKGDLYEALQQGVETIPEGDPQHNGIRLGEFKILDGQILYQNKLADHTETISNINGEFLWDNTSEASRIAGHGVWQGEAIESDIQVENLITLLAGGKSELAIVFKSTPLEFNFSGSASMHPDFYMTGELKSASPSLPRVFELLNLKTGYFGSLDNVTAHGILSATAGDMTLSEAQISIGESDATGVVRLSRNEDDFIKFDGTLAFDDIDANGFSTNHNRRPEYC